MEKKVYQADVHGLSNSLDNNGLAWYHYPVFGDPLLANTLQKGNYAFTNDGYLRYVLAVLQEPDGRYLMLKSLKHGGRFQCPGGKIDHGEEAPAALQREIAEELGCNINLQGLIGTRKVFAGGTLWQGEYYFAQLLGQPQILEPHKHDGLWHVTLHADPFFPTGFFMEAKTWVANASLGTLRIDNCQIIDETYDAVALHNYKQKGNLEQESFFLSQTSPIPPVIDNLSELYYISLANGYLCLMTSQDWPLAKASGARLLRRVPTSECKGLRIANSPWLMD
jgi:8-oxo-dGTP pyrophosphatase MutT (NUDIX family)